MYLCTCRKCIKCDSCEGCKKTRKETKNNDFEMSSSFFKAFSRGSTSQPSSIYKRIHTFIFIYKFVQVKVSDSGIYKNAFILLLRVRTMYLCFDETQFILSIIHLFTRHIHKRPDSSFFHFSSLYRYMCLPYSNK